MAIVALALGIVGLFTAGGLGLGSLLGLALATTALLNGASPRTGRDVAWAAIAANSFALLTLLPVAGALVSHREALLFFGDEPLPAPAATPPPMASADFLPPPPPPPLPPTSAPPTRVAPLRVGGTISEPRKTRHVNPVYPATAVQARVQGVVVLECTISPTGKVVAVRTLRGVPLLTEAAVEAVKQWEYTPTVLNGVAVPVIMTVTVNFKLS